MRSFTMLISVLTMTLGALGLAVAAPRHHDFATVNLEHASGALRMSSSRSDQSVFTVTAMRPGEGASGAVRIANDGDIAGRFGVRPVAVQGGPYGGPESNRVQLVLFDVTNVRQPLTVFAGHPSDFGEVDLGMFAAGESRDYVIAATLPDGDDELEQLVLGFQWRAGTVAAPTPLATPAPPR